MNTSNASAFLLIPSDDLKQIMSNQRIIIEMLEFDLPINKPTSSYITAMEYMDAVRIRRSRFDHLVATNQIKTIKKSRKIYVPIEEIENYFKNPNIK